MTVTACASPSLALVKYWGKLEGGVNLPATPSLGVTLGELRTTTTVTESRDADEVVVGGRRQPLEPYAPVIRLFRDRSSSSALRAGPIRVESENSFPTAAGLASSSSGFAAFALALDAWFETGLDREELSRAARMGSGSASRALWGGFTTWERGAAHAEPLLPASHWPELRVLVTVLHTGEKPVSSRAGMNRTSATSPIFEQWCDASQSVYERGLAALRAHKLDALGAAMRESYLFMFSTMFTTVPPVIYWRPESVALIHLAEELRGAGVPVWETMDAGPQVKLVTTEEHVPEVQSAILARVADAAILVASAGGEPEVRRDG